VNRIDRKFAELKASGKKAFMPYITAGDPTLEITKSLLSELESAGADIVELGVPFSDPVADGSSIQKAALRALKDGTSLRDIMKMVAEVRKSVEMPIVLMTYCNIVFRHGISEFVQDAVKAGADGVIVADLPPEEASELIAEARKHDFATIFLLAPTSTTDRIKIVSEACTGFVYCVSLTGVTGARKQISDMLSPMMDRIKQHTDKPLAVGFGVSSPDQAGSVAEMADGVIVGSAIVDLIEANVDDPKKLVSDVGEFTKKLVDAVKSV